MGLSATNPYYLTSADDLNVIGDPITVGDAGVATIITAGGDRRLPERNLVEIVEAVGGTAGIGEEFVAGASRRNRRNRSKPSGDIAGDFGINRVFQPLVSAV